MPKADIPTIDRDESLSVVREMYRMWKRVPSPEKRQHGERVIFVIEDLERYFEKGLVMPFDANVKKGIRTRLGELASMRGEIERTI